MITYYIDQLKILVQLTPECFGDFELKHFRILLGSLDSLVKQLTNRKVDHLSCRRAQAFIEYHKALLDAALCLDLTNDLSPLERTYVPELIILAEQLSEDFSFYDCDKYYSSKEVPHLERAG